MSRRAGPIVSGILLLWFVQAAHAADSSSELSDILEKKTDIVEALAKQIAYCSSRIDTLYPAFKGCIDWHSAVHGVWALVAYERVTGDQQYSNLISQILSQKSLENERIYLHGHPSFEMPYGRAWFLRLAIDYRALTGTTQLDSMADEIASSMEHFFQSNGIDRTSGAYESASWALINLLDYAKSRDLDDLRKQVEEWTKSNFVSVDPRCPMELEQDEFMAICTNWAALVARVLEQDEFKKWLDAFVTANGLPDPIKPQGAHSYGLNFSRAWGLWDIYEKTGRKDVLSVYIAHFNSGLTPASNWRGQYDLVGHWVAQFGMFAIEPLFGAQFSRLK
jgi:hypothetical protein